MSGATLVQGVIGLAAAPFLGPVIVFCVYPRSVRAWFEAGPHGVDAVASSAARDVSAMMKRWPRSGGGER